jgi:hypothetical protein
MNTFEVAEDTLVVKRKDGETNIHENRISQKMACTVLLMLLVMILQEILEHLDWRCEDQICWSL